MGKHGTHGKWGTPYIPISPTLRGLEYLSWRFDSLSLDNISPRKVPHSLSPNRVSEQYWDGGGQKFNLVRGYEVILNEYWGLFTI